MVYYKRFADKLLAEQMEIKEEEDGGIGVRPAMWLNL